MYIQIMNKQIEFGCLYLDNSKQEFKNWCRNHHCFKCLLYKCIPTELKDMFLNMTSGTFLILFEEEEL